MKARFWEGLMARSASEIMEDGDMETKLQLTDCQRHECLSNIESVRV